MEEDTQSYHHTPQTTPFLWTTLSRMLDERVRQHPDLEAYVVRRSGEPRESVTFAELKSRSIAIAAALKYDGLRKGDRVLITGITCIEWFTVIFACLRLGVEVMKCRMALLTKEGIEKIVNGNNIKALIYHPGVDNQFESFLQENFPELFVVKEEETDDLCSTLPSLQHLISMTKSDIVREPVTFVRFLETSRPSGSSRDPEREQREVREEEANITPDDTAVIYMTSGSTGVPKAIPCSHFSLVNSYHLVPSKMPDRAIYFNDRAMSWMASDIYSAVMVPHTTMVFVQPLTAASEQDLDFSIQVMREEECNVAILLQYMLHDLLERFERGRDEPVYLELALSGGEVLQYQLFERASAFVKRWGFSYGSTEAMCVATSDSNDDLKKQLEFAGKPPQGVEVKVIDRQGLVVKKGCVGEICVRSPISFRGYLQPETEGMQVDPSGWIHMDDAGIMKEGGYIKVLGRMSNVISRGISLIYPKVVEDLTLQCPAVSKAAVVGVLDKRIGEQIAAFVVAKAGETVDEGVLFGHFKKLYQTDEGLGHTPDHFFVVDEFPLNVNGKVDLRALREQAGVLVQEKRHRDSRQK